MCMVGDDYVDLLSSKTPKARKAHKCEECGRQIEPGENYVYETWLWEGDMSFGKTCLQCRAATHWLNIVCSGWVYNMVIDDLHEHIREEPDVVSSKLVRLVRYASGRCPSKKAWRRRDDTLIPEDEVMAWAKEAVERVPPLARGRNAA